jgi:predicted ATPase
MIGLPAPLPLMGTRMTLSTNRSFGALLRRLRLAAHLTQEELALKAALHPNAISLLECDARRPRRATIAMLADALDLEDTDRSALQAAGSWRWSSSTLPSQDISLARKLAHLVGRAGELRQIEHLLSVPERDAGETSGPPPLLTFSGEPGIGKSRLLREAARQGGAAGWTVLSGGCTRRGGQEPFEPFVSLLARTVASTRPAQQRRDLAGCGWLARLLPELADVVPDPNPSWSLRPEQERRLMFVAVRRFLTNIAGPSGTLLMLDDLQWAGVDALDLLADLIREPTTVGLEHVRASAPIRVIAAYRSTEVRHGDPLARHLDDLHATDTVSHSELGPLDAEQAAELLDDLLDDLLARQGTDDQEMNGRPGQRSAVSALSPVSAEARVAVLRRAAGVPFYLISAARVLTTADEQNGEASWQVPRTVAQSIRSRIEALPERARDLLGVAAIIGRVVPSALLLQLAARPGDDADEDAALFALESACAARLLLEQGRDYQFGHDLIREVVLDDLNSARARVLHRRVAELLSRQPDRIREQHLSEITQHYLDAGDGPAALTYALRAGDRAEAIYAHAEAERHYRTAVELAGALADQPHEAAALEKLGHTLQLLAHTDEALDTLERAAATFARTGNAEGELRSLAEALRIRAVLSKEFADAGVAHILPVLTDFESRGSAVPASPALVDVYSALSYLHLHRDRLSEAVEAAERAEQIAHALRDEALLARAQAHRAHALIIVGPYEDAQALLCAVIPALERTGGHTHLLGALTNLCELLWGEGEFALLERYARQLLEMAERHGAPRDMALGHGECGCYAFLVGEWPAAREHYEHMESIQRQLDRFGVSWFSAAQDTSLGQLEFAEGHDEAAERRFDQALAIAKRFDDVRFQRWIQWGRVERLLLADQPETARDDLDPLLDRPGQRNVYATLLLPFVAWADLELGRMERAEATVTACIERAATLGRLALADAYRVQAMIAIKQERWPDAETALEAGLTLTRSMPYPHAEAKALYIYGQLHRAKGEAALAREKYQAALGICNRLGEGLYRPHIERALATLPEATPLKETTSEREY